MKLDKLLKQLRRDATANPKKAALLGLMVVIALYFWAPLFVKFVPGNGASGETTELTSVNLLNNAPAPPAELSNRGSPRFQWDKVRDLIRKDEHMASATFNPAWVDPFAGKQSASESEPAPDEPKSEPEQNSAAKAARMIASLQPKDLGVSLGGIMISPRGRSATINGETCREGDVLSVAIKSDKTMSLDLTVLKIARQSVQLGTSGKIFTLELATPKLGIGDEFQAANTK